MDEMLDIGEVAKATGLTLRALRFYEGRGLVNPLRTAGGRRVYGRGELARLNAAVALKRAGFSLAKIADLLAGRTVDLARLIAAQIAEVEVRASALAESRALLLSVQSRIDRGEPIDIATLCSLIRSGEHIMETDNWKKVTDRYVDPAHKADWEKSYGQMPANFDQAAYSAKWDDLSRRIEAALPMDPASPEASAFYAEWQALLAPFNAAATPGMRADVGKLYDHIDEWKDEQKPPFSSEVWRFIQSVCRSMGHLSDRGA